MSPNSASKAEKLGYTNVKVYHEGLPAWTQKNYTVLSAQSLKEAWMDKEVPAVILDIRSADAAKKEVIKGAVSLPAGDVEKSLAKFPAKDLKPPIIIYSDTSGDDAAKAAKTLISAGYKNTKILAGGMAAWQEAKLAVENGSLNNTIAYVPKPKPGEMAMEDFKKIAASTPADTLILDVRNKEEAAAGMIKGAKCVPDEEILDRISEIPKDKKIVAHCSTGVRAEMAYHKLKEKGYNVQFLNAKIDINNDGNYRLERP